MKETINMFHLLTVAFGNAAEKLPSDFVKSICTLTEKVRDMSKHDIDYDRLCCRYGEMKPGMTLEVTLKELLSVCPRTRRRVDSYRGLVSYLHDKKGIKLIINSQKTKKAYEKKN